MPAPRAALMVLLFGIAPALAAAGGGVIRRLPSDIDGVDLTVACAPGPPAADYVAETASSIPLTDPYAVARQADKGLVTLRTGGDRRMARYIVPHRRIRAIVRLTYAMDVLDRTDLVVTSTGLILIHTTTANAGIFTVSDVYELPATRDAARDRKRLGGDPQLLHLLAVGLSLYRPGPAPCAASE